MLKCFDEMIPYALKPAFASASGAIIASAFFCFSPPLSFAIAVLLFSALFAKLFFGGNFLAFTISFLIVCASAYFFIREEKTYLSLPDNFSVIAKVEAEDFSLAGEEADWLRMPYHTYGRLKELRFSQYDQNPIIVDARIAIVLRGRKDRFSYGDVLEIKGRICKPADALFEGDFSQKDFFLSRKTSFLLYADEVRIIHKADCLQSKILNLRNRILSRICDGLSDENKKILAALIFGARQGIDPSSRRRLVLSGTIHVIAISGMHTAVFAFVALGFIVFLPFRLRYLILPLLVFLYVFCTGFPPSALRAFLMIAIWSLSKSFLYPLNGFVSILYAASLSLFLNPFSMLDIGFQYSFLITAFLIGGWRKASAFISVLDFVSRFKAGFTGQSYLKRAALGMFSTFIMCVIALFAGLPVSLFHQNLFNPLSVLVNLIITPFLYLIFLFSFLKIFVQAGFLADIFDKVLTFFSGLLMSFSDSALRIATPPFLPFLIFFCIPFFGLVFTKPGKRLSIVFAISVVLSVCACFILLGRGDKTYVISGEGRPPSLVAIRPDYESVFVINIPTREQSRKIIELLSSKGISRIDKLYCVEALKDYLEGASYLFSYFDCANLIFLSNPALSPFARFASQKAGENLVKVRIKYGKGKRSARRSIFDESETVIELSDHETITLRKCRSGNRLFSINSGGEIINKEVQNHLRMKLKEIEH